MFHVEITDAAKAEIEKKLEEYLQQRLYKRLKKLENAPDTFGKPLHWPLSGIWEFYFENRWRVLYEIDFNNKIVFVVGFKHKDEMQKR